MNILGRLIEWWVESSSRRPARAFVLSALGLAAVLGFLYWQTRALNADLESGGHDDQIQERMAQLDTLKDTLNDFETFIVQQRQQLADLQKAIQDLEKRRKTIEPVVSVDEQRIQRVIELAQRKTWYNRAEGVLLALIGGLTVQFIMSLLRRRKRASSKRTRI